MDLNWKEEQRDLYDSVVELCKEKLQHDVVAMDADGQFPQDSWQRCAEFGVLGWPVPKQHGGSGHSVTTTAYLMEAIGYGCEDNGLAFALGAQMWGVQTALLHFGSDAQIARYMPGLIRGELTGAYAITEEGSGSDAYGLDSTAVADGNDFVIRGEKVLVTFAPIADFAIVFAKTKPEAGRWGISAFLVDADKPGYTAHAVEQKMGLRTVPFGRITMDDCRVSADALLGKPGAGASIFNYSQGWERSLVLAPHLGAMQRVLDQCIDVARNRKRAGIAIGKHQAVSHRIADMKLRLETARLLLYKTAHMLENGKSTNMETALTKTYLSESFAKSSMDAIAIFGGEGYKTDAGIERNLRDAIGATIYGGTVDVQRNIVAGLLGL